jgi:hypothetical protein
MEQEGCKLPAVMPCIACGRQVCMQAGTFRASLSWILSLRAKITSQKWCRGQLKLFVRSSVSGGPLQLRNMASSQSARLFFGRMPTLSYYHPLQAPSTGRNDITTKMSKYTIEGAIVWHQRRSWLLDMSVQRVSKWCLTAASSPLLHEPTDPFAAGVAGRYS